MNDTTNQLKTLYENASPEVQAYFLTNELDGAVALFGKVYKLPIDLYLTLQNTITLILLGAIQPENVVSALQENCKMTEEDAYALATDLEKTIFQKVRLSVLKKDASEVKKLILEDENATKEELRKEILDTTKRPEPKPSETVDQNQKIQQVNLQPGSRSQLLEQLQVLETIPDDEEVGNRLNKIKDQIASIESKADSRNLDSNIALQEFMFGEKGNTVAKASLQSATYSRAPTTYNVDPYREVEW
ncbi:MAG: hypothetical protein WCK60_02840 [Candidatus Nomurabacteria bacterium]